MPILSVIMLFYAVGHWNSYFHPMIYITSREKQPLQVIMREIVLQNSMADMTNASEGFLEQAMFSESIKY